MTSVKKESTFADKIYFVQQSLNAPKNQRNNFGKYSYRSCEDILEGLKAVMPKGCFVNIVDEVIMVGERYYIKATAEFCDGDTTIKSSAFAREALTKKGMDEAQITGSASSYARKYALNGLFAIDDNKDPDVGIKNEVAKSDKIKRFVNADKPKELPPEMKPIGKDKAMELLALIKESDSELSNVIAYASKQYTFNDIKDMPICVYLELQTMLMKKIEANHKKKKKLEAAAKKEVKNEIQA